MAEDGMSAERAIEILERFDTALSEAEAATLARVNAALESSYQRLEERILRAYGNQAENLDLLPRQRSLLILDEVATYLELLNPMQQAQIQRDFEGLLRGAYEGGVRLSGELTRAIANQSLASFAAVPLEAVRLQAQESAKRLYRWSEEMRGKISGIVEAHLVMGSGARKMAESLRGELGIVKARAEMIARTESMASANLAAQSNYKRNGIEYIQVIATGDSRTCRICVARNGNVYRIGEISVPVHPRCRCYLMPWRKEWQALGLSDDQWFTDFREQAIAQLPAGQRPDYGPSSFEKAAGMTRAPEPAWTPGR